VPGVVLLDWMVLGTPPGFADALGGLQSPAWADVRDGLTSMWLDGLDIPDLTAYVASMKRYGQRHWSRAVIGVIFAEPNTPKIFKETGQVVKDIGYAIRNAVVLDFLDRHGVAWRSEAGGASLTREQAFDAAKPFVARIGCWR
jgi:hypothetical protein